MPAAYTYPQNLRSACREEDIAEIQREISMLKQCQSPQITAYFGSAVVPGTSQLMIVMELLAASAADLVSQVSCCATSGFDHQRHSQRCVL
jgi:serine/threonine protein kinase